MRGVFWDVLTPSAACHVLCTGRKKGMTLYTRSGTHVTEHPNTPMRGQFPASYTCSGSVLKLNIRSGGTSTLH